MVGCSGAQCGSNEVARHRLSNGQLPIVRQLLNDRIGQVRPISDCRPDEPNGIACQLLDQVRGQAIPSCNVVADHVIWIGGEAFDDDTGELRVRSDGPSDERIAITSQSLKQRRRKVGATSYSDSHELARIGGELVGE